MDDLAGVLERIKAGPRDESIRLIRELVFAMRQRQGERQGQSAGNAEPALVSALGEESWKLGLWPEAEFWARLVPPDAGPDSVVFARTLIVSALAQQGKAGAAVAEVLAAGEPPAGARDGAYFQLHLNEGLALARAGRSEEALARFGQADQYADAVDGTLLFALNLNRGMAFNQLDRQSEALAAYETALGHASGTEAANVLINIGNVHRDLGELDQAVDRYGAALEAAGDAPGLRGAALSNLARVRAMQGRRREAKAMLTEAAELRAAAGDLLGESISLDFLADLMAAELDFAGSRTVLRRSIELRRQTGLPDDEDCVERERRLTDVLGVLATQPDVAAGVLVQRLQAVEGLDALSALVHDAPQPVVDLARGMLEGPWADTLAPLLGRVLEVGPGLAMSEFRESQAKLGPVADMLVRLAAERTWLDRKRFYEARQAILEGDDARRVLPWMVMTAADHGVDRADMLATARLIEQCREKGVDRAFAELPPAVPVELVERFVNVGSWRESRLLVEAHPDYYLGGEAERVLQGALGQVSPMHRSRVQGHLDVLRRCREAGIAEAFAEVAEEAIGGQKFFMETLPASEAAGRLADLGPVERLRVLTRQFEAAGDPLLVAGVKLRLARAILESGEGDRQDNLREALGELLQARGLVSPAMHSITSAGIQTTLGDVLLELDEPGQAAESFLAVLEMNQPAWAPERVRRAAGGLHEAVVRMRDRPGAGPVTRGRLSGLRLQACDAAMAATDALVRTGELADTQEESAGTFWAYAGAVDERVAIADAAGALVAAERGRGRGFITEVGRLAELPDFVPESIARQEADARERLRTLRASGQESAETTAAIGVAERDLDLALDELARLSPALARIRRAEPPSLGELTGYVESLPATTMVLCWFTTYEHCFAFALRGASATIGTVRSARLALGWDQILAYADLAVADIWHRPSDPGQRLSPVWTRLMNDLVPAEWQAEIAEAERLVLIPHGPLHELPLHAIPVDWLGGRSLVEALPVTYVPSLTLAGRIKDRVPHGTPVVVGYASDDAPEFAYEAAAVAATLGAGEPLHGRHADIGTVVARARDASILHIAAHGVFDPAHPLDSGLILSDGTLTARTIIQSARLPGSLVVLSGCESNRRLLTPADESEGLVRALFVAGAGQVVASQWRVDSASTADLMDGLYRHLDGTGDVALALRSAAADLRERLPHPYFWAPFVVVGG